MAAPAGPTPLPPVLAGPIVRRVTTAGAAVWLALPRAAKVRLYVAVEGGRFMAGALVDTVALGAALHVVVATYRGHLPAGATCTYRLAVVDGAQVDDAQALIAAAGGRLALTGFDHPSFVVPPEALDELRLAHGSCRKPHGEGADALPQLAGLLDDPAQRAHQLLLTGDQIYADDVAGPMLVAIVGLADRLVGTTPGARPALPPGGRTPLPDDAFDVYRRGDVVRDALGADDDAQACHLVRFEEFAAMYLLVWSPDVWLDGVPPPADAVAITRGRSGTLRKAHATTYAAAVPSIERFRAGVTAVRQALANVATYTAIDDHEVTDDWALDPRWIKRAFEQPVGRAIVRHALAAYALFQGWGNDPDALAPVIAAIAAWRARPGDRRRIAAVDAALGMPASGKLVDGMPGGGASPWTYRVPGPSHELIVLELHSRRRYGRPAGWNAELIASEVIADAVRSTRPLAIVVSPMAVIEPSGFELQRRLVRQRGTFAMRQLYDGDLWLASTDAYAALVAALCANPATVVLAGDVHYGFGGALVDRTSGRRVPCLIASPLCNAFVGATRAALDAMGRSVPDDATVERDAQLIWSNHLGLIEFTRDAGTLVAHHTWLGASGVRHRSATYRLAIA